MFVLLYNYYIYYYLLFCLFFTLYNVIAVKAPLLNDGIDKKLNNKTRRC